MSLSGNNMDKPDQKASLVSQLKRDFGQFKFKAGKSEHWSPRTNTISYNPSHSGNELNYGLLHELAHALLGHTRYNSDFELLKMESLAWQEAARIGKRYKINVGHDHIQNCLDTYRDWLHRRSACPTCGAHSLQINTSHYQCYNCQHIWRVSLKRFARPYRLSKTA